MEFLCWKRVIYGLIMAIFMFYTYKMYMVMDFHNGISKEYTIDETIDEICKLSQEDGERERLLSMPFQERETLLL